MHPQVSCITRQPGCFVRAVPASPCTSPSSLPTTCTRPERDPRSAWRVFSRPLEPSSRASHLRSCWVRSSPPVSWCRRVRRARNPSWPLDPRSAWSWDRFRTPKTHVRVRRGRASPLCSPSSRARAFHTLEMAVAPLFRPSEDEPKQNAGSKGPSPIQGSLSSNQGLR